MSVFSKVLLLSGWRIFPEQTGGHLRTGSFAKALARLGHEVRIGSLAGRAADYKEGQTQLECMIEDGLREDVDLSLWFGLCQALARRLSLPRLWQYPLLKAGWIPDSLYESLLWADVIISDLPCLPPVKGPWDHKPWLLLSHNLEYQLLRQGTWLDRRLFAPLMLHLEKTALLRYDAVLACAHEDFSFFNLHNSLNRPVHLIPNGIDAARYQPNRDQRALMRRELALEPNDRLILFSGSRYTPNLEALLELQTFAAREADFLRAHRIKFLILGSMSSAMRSDVLIATGFVPSVQAYFHAADFAINPVQRGSGSNVKVFEYMAAHLPILSTEFGVRGTELVPGQDYMPFTMLDLKTQLQDFIYSRDAEAWRAFAESVWQRYAARCDMTSIVEQQWNLLEQSLKAKFETEALSPVTSQPLSLI